MDKNRSMVDVAYELMSKKKKAVNFYKLWQEVSEVKGFDEEEKNEKESLFYTNITLDGRFITVGENNWDLRSRHKFDEVHIDMNDIYTDEDEESEEVEEKQAEEITETKEIVETIEENPVEDIEENDTFIEDEEEIIENKGESKVVKVMNVIIVILVIIFIALLGVILYQSFF